MLFIYRNKEVDLRHVLVRLWWSIYHPSPTWGLRCLRWSPPSCASPPGGGDISLPPLPQNIWHQSPLLEELPDSDVSSKGSMSAGQHHERLNFMDIVSSVWISTGILLCKGNLEMSVDRAEERLHSAWCVTADLRWSDHCNDHCSIYQTRTWILFYRLSTSLK